MKIYLSTKKVWYFTMVPLNLALIFADGHAEDETRHTHGHAG